MAQAKTLSKQELKRVLDYNDACERHSERNRAMLLFTHLCGMRIGEVVALRVSDVIDDNGEVKGELRLCAEQTKGSRARVVFVSMRMRKEIKRYVEHLIVRSRSDFLFRTQKSHCFSSNSATQLLQRIYERSGHKGATSHSGRRSFITELASKGVGVRVLAELSGHRSIATTQRYIDVNDDMLRKAVELV